MLNMLFLLNIYMLTLQGSTYKIEKIHIYNMAQP